MSKIYLTNSNNTTFTVDNLIAYQLVAEGIRVTIPREQEVSTKHTIKHQGANIKVVQFNNIDSYLLQRSN